VYLGERAFFSERSNLPQVGFAGNYGDCFAKEQLAPVLAALAQATTLEKC
jgi:hypothetical protein